jgi:hypothetical protein
MSGGIATSIPLGDAISDPLVDFRLDPAFGSASRQSNWLGELAGSN